MASAGSRSELHALVFDTLYIHFKSNDAGVTLHFTPEFAENHRLNQFNDPWYIPAVLTGKPVCSNCPSEGAQILS